MNQSKFLKNVLTLLSGTLFSQAIMLASMPILTRIYTPQDFGVLSVFVGIVGMITVISSLRYNRAIPIPQSTRNAEQILFLGGILISLIVILFFTVSFLIKGALDNEVFNKYLNLMSVAIFISSFFDILSYWALRVKSFKSVAKGKVATTLVTVIVQFSLSSIGPEALIYGQVAGLISGLIILALSLSKTINYRSYNYKRVLVTAKRYKDFPLYSTWEALANSIGTQLPVFLFAYFFSAGTAGLFALTYKVLNLPMTMLGAAIGQAFLSRAADARRLGNLGHITSELYKVLCSIGFPPAVMLMVIAPKLFLYVFGSEWEQAGDFAQLMVPWLLLVFISSPLSSIISVSEKQKQGLLFQIFFLLMRASALIMGGLLFDIKITIIMLVIANAISLIVFIYWILGIAHARDSSIVRHTFTSFIYSIICNSPIIITSNLFPDDTVILIVSLALSIMLVLFRYYKLKLNKLKL